MGFRKHLFVFIFTFLFALLKSNLSFAEAKNYYTPLSNFERTSYYYSKGPEAPELNFKKNIFSGNLVHPYGVITDSEGSIYVPLRYKVVKFSKEGELIWEYNVEPKSSWAMSAPLIYEDRLYFIASYGAHYIFCLDLDGNLIWKQDLRVDSASGLSFMVSPVVVDGVLYVQTLSPLSIRGYNKDTGDFIGIRYYPTFSTPYINYLGVLASGNLVVSTISGDISGLDLKRIFSDEISLVNNNHLLFLYKNKFNPSSIPTPMSNIVLDLNNNSRVYVVVNNYGGGIAAKLFALNQVLQKDWDVNLEGISKGNIAVDKEGNIYVDVKVGSFDRNIIYSFNKDGEKRWEYSYGYHDSFPNIVLDAKGALYAAGREGVFALNSSDGSLIWDYATENSVIVAPVLDAFGNLIIVDSKGSLYSFKGAGEYTECKRRFYCNENTPKHNPVVFVHGLGGSYKDWITGNKKEMRELILEKYREDDPDFPDEWAYAYHYGYDFLGNYNYEGDVRVISQGLLEAVARLSRENLEAGGDGKVDLVGFSLGGLIIRQYLANTVGDIEKDEDNYNHHIDKAILIATPNKGSWIMTLDEYVRAYPVLGPFIERKLVSVAESIASSENLEQPLHGNSYAVRQVTPGSDLLSDLDNKDLLPEEVGYYLVGSNLKARRGGVLYGIDNWTEYENLGDLVVLEESWAYLPREPKKKILYDDTMEIKWEMADLDNMWTLRAEVPNLETVKMTHRGIIKQPRTREDIINILVNN